MAKQKTTKATSEPINNLDTQLVINDTKFNINAVQADKVANNLIINMKCYDENDNCELKFNGESDVEVNLVPAEGGTFTGPIKVPTVDEHKKADNDYEPDGNTVVNYSDLNNKILNDLMKTSIVYSWISGSISPTLGTLQDSAISINSISLVLGEDVNTFAKYNNDQYVGYTKATTTEARGKFHFLRAFLFLVCEEKNGELNAETANQIYFGVCDSINPMSISIGTAGALATGRKITVDLGRTVESESFNGASDVDISVKGFLPMAHGGLGDDISSNTQAAKSAEYYINGSIEEESTASVTDDTYMLFKRNSPRLEDGMYCRKKASDLWDYLVGKIRFDFGFSNDDNVLPVTNGGTGAKSLDSIKVGKATKDADDHDIRYSYYQVGNQSIFNKDGKIRKITYSSDDPESSAGNIGDIWIKYKA